MSNPVCTSRECVHSIVEDLIDISPDRCMYIYYCDICYECFANLEGAKLASKSKPANTK